MGIEYESQEVSFEDPDARQVKFGSTFILSEKKQKLDVGRQKFHRDWAVVWMVLCRRHLT